MDRGDRAAARSQPIAGGAPRGAAAKSPDIVVTEFMDAAAIASLAQDFIVAYDEHLHKQPEALAAVAANCRALIVRNRTQVRRPLIEALPLLVAVGRLGVGLDNIDVAACRERGIAVLPATGANADAVAEYVVTGLLLLFRRAFQATERVANGDWPRDDLIGREVAGKVLGLIGFGGTARAVAVRAAALGMRVSAYDPALSNDAPAWAQFGAVPRSFDRIIAEADAISLHLPLTDATRGLIGAATLAHMKPTAILINAARGGIVDEAALARALVAGRLGGALLDVYAAEPLGADNPFHGVPNLLLTPHIAGVTAESNARVGTMVANAVRQALEGRS